MIYLSICNSKKGTQEMARAADMDMWTKVCQDEQLHRKCRKIKCYETEGDSPPKLMLMIDTDDPDALNMLSADFGKDWSMVAYPVHEMQEILEEDHSIVAG